MTRRDAFGQLILSRIREFYREPVAIFWVYGFPLILAIILGIAFSSSEPVPPRVDVQEGADAERLAKVLRDHEVQAEVHSESDCRKRYERGQTVVFLVPQPNGVKYIYDPARSESLLALKWVQAILAQHDLATRDPLNSNASIIQEEQVREPGKRYIDWFMPGLLGMNIMGGGLFGVGFVLVDMRVRKLFKRLMATPMHRGDFLWSVLTARLLFLLPEMAILLLAARLLFGVPVQGSWLTLLLVIVVGAFAFSGVGLLIGCRTEKNETASGLLNLVMLPMYLLSGVFFRSQNFPDAMQPFIQALPLTQLNDALREVMLDGDGLATMGWRLAVLAVWGGVTFFLALRWFKWR